MDNQKTDDIETMEAARERLAAELKAGEERCAAIRTALGIVEETKPKRRKPRKTKAEKPKASARPSRGRKAGLPEKTETVA